MPGPRKRHAIGVCNPPNSENPRLKPVETIKIMKAIQEPHDIVILALLLNPDNNFIIKPMRFRMNKL